MGILNILAIAVLAVVVLLIVVGVIDGNRFVLVKERFELPCLKKDCRFVLLSDLHNKVYGNENDKVIEAIDKINPNFIIIAGDLVTSRVEVDMTPGIELAKKLGKKYKVYYAMGNHETKIRLETDKFGGKFEKLKKEVSGSSVVLLQNEGCYLPEYNINITGLELDLKYYAHFRVREMEKGYLDKILPKCDKSRCNLLIAHNPSYFEEYSKWGANLVLSGHVHGGIMRLPFIGGVIAPSYTLFPKYDGGVFKNGDSTMLLGRGMGAHTLPFRFFNPAELYAVELKACTFGEKKVQ